MRKVLASCVLMSAVCVGGFLGYTAYNRHRDIIDTLAWIDQTYNPHKGADFGMGHGTEQHYRPLPSSEILEKAQTTFSGGTGCHAVIHHEQIFPVSHYLTYEDSMNLCDVDPASIKIKKYDSHQYVFDCSDPEQVELYQLNCDSATIFFHTYNDKPAIMEKSAETYSELKGTNSESKLIPKKSTEYFTVDDDVYAQRLAAAFKHAVELCGGRPSKF